MPSILKKIGIFPVNDAVEIPATGIPEEQLIHPEPETTDTFEELQFETLQIDDDDTSLTMEVEQESEPQISLTPEYMTEEEIAEFYKLDIEKIKKQAYDDAYEKGYHDALFKKRGEIQECIQKVDESLAQIQSYQYKFMDQYSTELKYLAVDIAEKLILHKIDENEMLLEKLIMKTVSGVRNTAWFDVEVSDRLVELIDRMREEIKNAKDDMRVTITPKATAKDTCRVNTEEGTIVSTISTQAQNIREMFKKADRQ